MPTTEAIRRLWGRLDPCHAFIYFSPDAGLAYAGLGLQGAQGYFASRSAALGAVGPEVVVPTFFNFKPEVVAEALPSAWEIVTPEQVLAARFDAAEATLRTCLDELAHHPDLRATTELVTRATAGADPEGRTLFAGHASLDWPDEPLQRWWHAITLMREYRGDAHVAALVVEGFDAPEALVIHEGTGKARLPRSLTQATRGWTDDEWSAAEQRLRDRGLMDTGSELTEAGKAAREHVEFLTDRGTQRAWGELSDDELDRLTEAIRPFSRAIAAKIFGG